MLVFFLVDAVAFLVRCVLPMAVHAAFLPIAFSVSRDAGLDAVILWMVYYSLEAVAELTLPSILVSLVSAFAPLVALAPVVRAVLSATSAGPAATVLTGVPVLGSPVVRSLFTTSLLLSPPLLAVAEAVATVIVIKQIGAILKHELIDDGAGSTRTAVMLALLGGYLAAVAQLVRLAWTGEVALMTVVVAAGAAHAVVLLIPAVAEPGENDVPAAEGLLLVVYTAFVLTVTQSAVVGPGPAGSAFGFAESSSSIRALLAYLTAAPTLTLGDVLSGTAAYLTGLVTLFPWPLLARLAYRTAVIMASVAAVRGLPSDKDEARASAAAFAFAKPLLLVYYTRVLVETHGHAPAWASTDGLAGVLWTVPVAIGVYVLILFARR
ncbi:hypothetical protein H9P43_001151 [Blastocladiella emersonii ATCC 22665]|nr:hypothetical protein H9P43_001151 [Blastocladiella emersonii ATCC 22665]